MTTQHNILRLGHQGDGIADGPVYAARTMPGEVVQGTLDGAQLTDIRIQTPSPDRVQPSCRHYKSCGGCQLQHASESFVSEWKKTVVTTAIEAQGLSVAMREVVTSNPNSRRRAVVAARRTKKGALAGFHARGSNVITEISECQLIDPALQGGLAVAEALAVIGASRKGELSVTLTASQSGLDVAVSGGKPTDGPLQIALAQLAERFDLARIAWDDEVIAMRKPPIQTFGSAEVVPPPGAFLQATASGEAALLGAVCEITKGADRIVDLFAGCGTFSLPLAAEAEVHAVEGDAEMIQAMDQGWRKASGLKLLSSEARDLYRRPLLPEELSRFDTAVIDPPRAGAEAQIEAIANSNLDRLAYVSCNPVSFARDAKILVGSGYRLDWIKVVDQFRWSSHIELVAAFSGPMHQETGQIHQM